MQSVRILHFKVLIKSYIVSCSTYLELKSHLIATYWLNLQNQPSYVWLVENVKKTAKQYRCMNVPCSSFFKYIHVYLATEAASSHNQTATIKSINKLHLCEKSIQLMPYSSGNTKHVNLFSWAWKDKFWTQQVFQIFEKFQTDLHF